MSKMNKKQLNAALEAHKKREAIKAACERASRLTVTVDYPQSHNPYLPHEKVEDCYAGCVIIGEATSAEGKDTE